MGKAKDLSKAEVNQVEALLRTGTMTMRQIAAQVGISRGSVGNIKARLQENVTGASRAGKCGRKRQTSKSMDRLMVRTVRQEPLLSASQVKSRVGATVSTRTVRRRLREMGCRSVKPRKVHKLTAAMMKKRLNFALAHANWSVADWRRVIFRDESTFECQMASRKRVWHPPKSPPPVRQTVKHPTKVMV